MLLPHDIHLGYCTNIHRGETWEETWRGLREHTLRVKERVSGGKPYGIGLRLSQQAAVELSAPGKMAEFKRWLDQHGCYVFTINGFPYGDFHGKRVKEQVFKPDWATQQRLDYTKLLFDLLAQLLPAGVSGSVSTLPGSHKTFGVGADELRAIFENLKLCRQHIEKVAESSGHDLHLGLEPEPLGLFETSGETLKFFGLYLDQNPQDRDFFRYIGLNYDTCHLAIEFEDAAKALDRITGAGIRLSKLHFSSALRLQPTPEAVEKLAAFDEPVYFHQVIASHGPDEPLRRFTDLPDALAFARANPTALGEEWRVHFHIPLHAQPAAPFDSTREHLLGAMDWLGKHPQKCQHIEMETYTWEVLPAEMRSGDVADQLVREYEWTLAEMRTRGLA
ncbi:MAG: metabolite traffic protein EboE [Verrucomicrobiaceae bacterium]|nr:metabolite traffic protein EboE [Verrucomicrobiaceae bacterium]